MVDSKPFALNCVPAEMNSVGRESAEVNSVGREPAEVNSVGREPVERSKVWEHPFVVSLSKDEKSKGNYRRSD